MPKAIFYLLKRDYICLQYLVDMIRPLDITLLLALLSLNFFTQHVFDSSDVLSCVCTYKKGSSRQPGKSCMQRSSTRSPYLL